MDFGACIEIYGAFLASFSEYNALSIIKINIRDIELYKLSDIAPLREAVNRAKSKINNPKSNFLT